jgi:drug/metabolite transporter (DMT)-like permease
VLQRSAFFFIVGLPDFHRIDKRYLYFGIPTANLSSLSFCLAILTSSGGAQTMEVGMVNYLWPSLTILFAVLFNGVRTRWWLYPGLLVAFGGIIVILSGDKGFSLTEFVARFAENPVSYLLALVGAVTWAGYSSMTRAWGNRINPSTIIFAVDTLVFLVLWLLDIGSQPVAASAHGLMSVIFGGIAVGMAYVVWTLGMSKGNITVLAPEIKKLFEETLAAAWFTSPTIGRELATRLGIRRLPAVAVYCCGEMLGAIEGLRPWREYQNELIAILTSRTKPHKKTLVIAPVHN